MDNGPIDAPRNNGSIILKMTCDSQRSPMTKPVIGIRGDQSAEKRTPRGTNARKMNDDTGPVNVHVSAVNLA